MPGIMKRLLQYPRFSGRPYNPPTFNLQIHNKTMPSNNFTYQRTRPDIYDHVSVPQRMRMRVHGPKTQGPSVQRNHSLLDP